MKIGTPVLSDDASLNNTICDHFGSAPFFAVVETELGTVKIIKNDNAHHQHGMCNPLAALASEQIEAVLVRGIGAGAVSKLQASGIPVFQATANVLKNAIEDLKANRLTQMSPEGACAGHHGHDHSHS